jgi:hypothetical protein
MFCKLVNEFWNFHVKNKILEYSKRLCIFLHKILSFEKRKFENYNIFTNYIISVKKAKVLW